MTLILITLIVSQQSMVIKSKQMTNNTINVVTNNDINVNDINSLTAYHGNQIKTNHK